MIGIKDARAALAYFVRDTGGQGGGGPGLRNSNRSSVARRKVVGAERAAELRQVFPTMSQEETNNNQRSRQPTPSIHGHRAERESPLYSSTPHDTAGDGFVY